MALLPSGTRLSQAFSSMLKGIFIADSGNNVIREVLLHLAT